MHPKWALRRHEAPVITSSIQCIQITDPPQKASFRSYSDTYGVDVYPKVPVNYNTDRIFFYGRAVSAPLSSHRMYTIEPIHNLIS